MLQAIIPELHTVMSENFKTGLEILATQPFDLVILDLNVPGGGNPAMIGKIRELQTEVRILIFSGCDEMVYALPCLQAGADGYLSKNSSDEEFVTAIKSIINNRKYLSAEMHQQALQAVTGNSNMAKHLHPAQILSAREMEVMQLLLKGLGTAEIAARIHLQLSTISTYKMKIFEKMGVKNIVELVEKMKMYTPIP